MFLMFFVIQVKKTCFLFVFFFICKLMFLTSVVVNAVGTVRAAGKSCLITYTKGTTETSGNIWTRSKNNVERRAVLHVFRFCR